MTHSRSPVHARPSGFVRGCLVALLIVIAFIVVCGIYVATHWRGWTASAMTTVSEQVVAKADLPQAQKDQILAEVRKLGDDFKAGRISVEQMKRVGAEIASSPLLPLAGVQAARQKYIDPSDMKPEEKAAAIRSLQRFARGIYERKITPAQQAIDEVIKPIADLKPDGRWELQDKPTRQNLDQFIANAKAKADQANIPDEPFDLNIAEELKKAIDKALKS